MINMALMPPEEILGMVISKGFKIWALTIFIQEVKNLVDNLSVLEILHLKEQRNCLKRPLGKISTHSEAMQTIDSSSRTTNNKDNPNNINKHNNATWTLFSKWEDSVWAT